jgi:hypothetical protein
MWYLKKTWFDQEPGIDAVTIHYTFTPLFQAPDWRLAHETRPMEKNARIKQGFGGTTLAAEDVATLPITERPATAPANARVKVISMPSAVFNPMTRRFDEDYLFHHFYDVWRGGRVASTTSVFTEQIASQEIELVDWHGNITGACAHWSVYDGDAFVYSPTETPDFIARFGEDNELRSHKLYGHHDRSWFMRVKWALIQQLPLPRRWRTKVWAPKGVPVIQGWHVGFADYPAPAGAFPRGHEEFTGYTVRTL